MKKLLTTSYQTDSLPKLDNTVLFHSCPRPSSVTAGSRQVVTLQLAKGPDSSFRVVTTA